MDALLSKKCIPCEGGALPLRQSETDTLHEQTPAWTVTQDLKKISREYKFKDFAEAMEFANKIAVIAEEEGHHPDLLVSWGKVRVELATHEVGGLSENDFILAAKIDTLQ